MSNICQKPTFTNNAQRHDQQCHSIEEFISYQIGVKSSSSSSSRQLMYLATLRTVRPPPFLLSPPLLGSRLGSRSYTLNTGSTTLPITTALTNVCNEGTFAKFDETVSLHVLVTLDPRKPNQNIRTKISLPHGTGSKVKILVMTDDDAAREKAAELGGEGCPFLYYLHYY